MIEMTSGLSVFTKKGFVLVTWGKMSGQLTPEGAIQHGLAAIEAGFGAQSDEIMWATLDDIGFDEEEIVRFLSAMRKRREADE